MKRKLTFLIGSVVVLILVVVGILYLNGTFNTMDPADFTIEDSDRVGKIFLADRQNKTILLERQSQNEWLLNGEYKARQSSVEQLLRTMRQMKAKAPISEAATENITRGMMVENTRVEVYDRNGSLMKDFFVGSEARGGRGNYMMRAGADQIYVVHIPGFHGGVTSRFFTDASLWRDRTVFAYQPGEIRQITVQYPYMPSASFQLAVHSRDSFRLEAVSEKAPAYGIQPLKQNLAHYVNNFQDLKAEAYVNHLAGKDTILEIQPFCIMEVTDTTGATERAEFYYKPVSKRTKTQTNRQGRPLRYDRERSYALINEGQDFVLVQQFVFGKVFKQYEHFFENATTSKETS